MRCCVGVLSGSSRSSDASHDIQTVHGLSMRSAAASYHHVCHVRSVRQGRHRQLHRQDIRYTLTTSLNQLILRLFPICFLPISLINYNMHKFLIMDNTHDTRQ